MFRDLNKKAWPTEINDATATIIILNAIESFIGGEALDSEMAPDNPDTIRAMEDLEELSQVLWNRYGRTGKWLELASALEDRIIAGHRYLVNMENEQAARVMEEEARKIEAAEVQESRAKVETESEPKISGKEVCAS